MVKLKKKEYWGEKEERAVVEYLQLKNVDLAKADLIFQQTLYKPLKKLVENIMFTYRLSIPNEDVSEQVMDCMVFVVYKMDRYNPDLETKAFSYYGTIAKNYMIAKKNKNQTKINSFVDIDDVVGFEHEQGLFVGNEYEGEVESLSFLISVAAEDIERALEGDLTLDSNTYKLGEAIVTLLKNYQDINIQHKRQFYFIAREFTGLTAKEITKSLHKIQEIFDRSNR